MRHKAATSKDFPAWDVVPTTIIAFIIFKKVDGTQIEVMSIPAAPLGDC